MKCAPELLPWDNVYLCCDALLSDLLPPVAPLDLQLAFPSQGITACMWRKYK